MKDEQRADFFVDTTLGQKAVVTEGDGGDLWIEGLAADYGMDEQDEAFEDGAFADAVNDFKASGNMPLLYHHKGDQQLGEVTELEIRPEGLWMKARIDKPAHNSHPLYDVYTKVKRGTTKGLSVAGRFFRRMSPDGMKIYRANLREISVTPLPVNERTLVAAGAKAFSDEELAPPTNDADPKTVISKMLTDMKALMAAAEATLENVEVETSKEGQADGEIGAGAPAAEVEPAQTEEPKAAGNDEEANDNEGVVQEEPEASAPAEDDEESKDDKKAVPELIPFRAPWQDKLETHIDGRGENISFKAWDGRPSRFTDEQYIRSCLVKGTSKETSFLPVREPNGQLNGRAVSAAKALMPQLKLPENEAVNQAEVKLDQLDAVCERARLNRG